MSQPTTICHYCRDTVSPNVICDDVNCPLKGLNYDRIIDGIEHKIFANESTKFLHSSTGASKPSGAKSNYAKYK